MADEQKQDKVEVTRAQLDALIESSNKSAERAEAAMKRAEAAEKQMNLMAKKGGGGIETTAQRFEKDIAQRMYEEPKVKQEAKLHLSGDPSTNALEDVPMVNQDKCPYCIKTHAKLYAEGKEKGTTYEVIDLHHGKYVCRRCGKHWVAWAIFPEDGSPGPMEYSLYLEQGNREKVEEMQKIKLAKAGMPVQVK